MVKSSRSLLIDRASEVYCITHILKWCAYICTISLKINVCLKYVQSQAQSQARVWKGFFKVTIFKSLSQITWYWNSVLTLGNSYSIMHLTQDSVPCRHWSNEICNSFFRAFASRSSLKMFHTLILHEDSLMYIEVCCLSITYMEICSVALPLPLPLPLPSRWFVFSAW